MIAPGKPAAISENNLPLLAATDLCLTYPGTEAPAVDLISLALAPGELCGLIGPNGAGKTSLLSLLATLRSPDRGTLRLAGIDALAAPAEARRHIGYVPQDLALYERLTIDENLRFFGKMYGLDGPMLKERVETWLALFGLADKRRRLVRACSGGMKRRLNLIVGLLHQPRLLFLDEPTVGIDTQSRHLILEKLAELNQAGMAMIYSSHYLEEVQSLCRRVVIIDRGRIVAEDSPEGLLAQAEGYRSLSQLFLQTTGSAPRE